ncbi:ArsR/SmtB family transcription factor [Pseudohalocynthiibacter aestuariivivens]|jgi:DNA-binding transcriptional ArsR family regulator|uniref:ArsR/SmtB family transcription factor n=1 Tax=Pseudohalocynthiibacter aestuariivivens TaxID=1591409 RepID=A0ABV5JB00_9RHOB|nr:MULTISPECIES: winged helix-turn-helix domain-containing protein [Pseudohalocynthiibacter]MBS9716865.1 winged helix-turn-helix transcriptional regulator [Pseudohalocynthiibacter aestuariivivens]MCK0102042.1 winged helix-turn-helix domain-containing protein [Pseudohalocynthiibacter sp. F2068]
MKEGPDIALTASLIGDPARANMLVALMDGRALTATELATEAGVTKQTASTHLARLVEGQLLTREVQGRHHYFRLTGSDVGAVLEALMGISAHRTGHRARPGPRDPALRYARVCYDHLAGEIGVTLFDRAKALGWMSNGEASLKLSNSGRLALTRFGLDMDELESQRRPVCRSCLDWSMRRHHLAGGLGKALLQEIFKKGWARRLPDSRVVAFSTAGKSEMLDWLNLASKPSPGS